MVTKLFQANLSHPTSLITLDKLLFKQLVEYNTITKYLIQFRFHPQWILYFVQKLFQFGIFYPVETRFMCLYVVASPPPRPPPLQNNFIQSFLHASFRERHYSTIKTDWGYHYICCCYCYQRGKQTDYTDDRRFSFLFFFFCSLFRFVCTAWLPHFARSSNVLEMMVYFRFLFLGLAFGNEDLKLKAWALDHFSLYALQWK